LVFFFLEFFTIIRSDLQTLAQQEECFPIGCNSCVRVAPLNNYRSGSIQIDFPVTFKQDKLFEKVKDFVVDEYFRGNADSF
jgi:hypothetical protein